MNKQQNTSPIEDSQKHYSTGSKDLLPHIGSQQVGRASLSTPAKERFCKIFPHRWDWLFSEELDPETKKRKWLTIGEKQWQFAKWKKLELQLSNQKLIELWRSDDCTIGVGFGKETSYLMLDVDRGSRYHPFDERKAFNHLLGAMEELGLTRYIVVSSSESGGLHVYFPLPEPVKSFALAATVNDYLVAQKFDVKSGQLELFPNKKSKSNSPNPADWSKYQQHRLPLQWESCVLDDELQPVHNSLEQFVGEWDVCAAGQDIETLKNYLSQFQSRVHSQGKGNSSPTIQAMKREYEELLQTGWTGKSQTNEILKQLTKFLIIFDGLQGQDLEEKLIEVVIALPGYEPYCSHKHEIKQRCRDWARCGIKRWTPLTAIKKTYSTPVVVLGKNNHEKKLDALERIQNALKLVSEAQERFANQTAFLKQLAQLARCSFSTLQKWKQVWENVWERLRPGLNKNPSQSTHQSADDGKNLGTVCNCPPSRDCSNSEGQKTFNKIVCNALLDKEFKSFPPDTCTKGVVSVSVPTPLLPDEEDPSPESVAEFNSRVSSVSAVFHSEREQNYASLREPELASAVVRSDKPDLQELGGMSVQKPKQRGQRINGYFIPTRLLHLHGTPLPEGDITDWALANPNFDRALAEVLPMIPVTVYPYDSYVPSTD